MPSVLHEVDPDGDLVVVLKEPNTQKVVPDVYLPPPKGSENPGFILDDKRVTNFWEPSGLPLKEDQDDESPVEVRFRVSSHLMMMVSEVFKKMLSGPWKESQPVNSQHLNLQEMHEGSYAESPSDNLSPGLPSNQSLSHSPCTREVSATGWNAYALLTVFRIIHGQTSEVPRGVSWGLFAQVAIIANYYRCAEALSFAAELWLKRSDRLEDLVASPPRHESRGFPYPRLLHYGRDLIMLLFIAWQFPRVRLFREVTYSVVMGGHGLCYVETYDLPISHILSALEEKRLHGIHTLTSALSDMSGKVKCNDLGPYVHLPDKASKAMVLGILELSLEEHPELTVKDGNYDGLSLADAIHTVEHEFGLNEPRQVEWAKDMDFVTPTTLMGTIISDVEKEIEDISIYNLNDRCSKAW